MTRPAIFEILGPGPMLRWGADEARTRAALATRFDTDTGPDPSYRGEVLGVPGCVLYPTFGAQGLEALEVVFPGGRAPGATARFFQVFGHVLKAHAARVRDQRFEVRRGAEAQVAYEGPSFCTPSCVAIPLDSDHARVDRGELTAIGQVQLRNGGTIEVRTFSSRYAARHKRYASGCVALRLGRAPLTPVPKRDGLGISVRLGSDGAAADVAAVEDGNVADYEPDAYQDLKRRAEGGELAAQQALARVYLEGELVPVSRDGALRWTRAALAQGDEAAVFRLAVLLINRWDTFYPPFWWAEPSDAEFREAVPLLERAGERGHARAWRLLATLHHNGQGVPRDLGAYRACLERAAAGGDPAAAYSLAECIRAERGEEAYWGQLEVAARLGNPHAALELAWHHYMPWNPAEADRPDLALPWLELAALLWEGFDSNTGLNARGAIGDLYAGGHGVTQDWEQALTWYLVQKRGYRSPQPSVEKKVALARAQLGEEAIARAQAAAEAWLTAHPRTGDRLHPF